MAAIDVQVTASPTVEITHPNVIIGTCADGTVENSDQTVSLTVGSGDMETFPDTDFSINSELVVEQPSGVDKNVTVTVNGDAPTSTTVVNSGLVDLEVTGTGATLEIGVYSDAGLTTPITEAAVSQTIYINIQTTGLIGSIDYRWLISNVSVDFVKHEQSGNATLSYTVTAYNDVIVYAEATDGSITAANWTATDITVDGSALADAFIAAHNAASGTTMDATQQLAVQEFALMLSGEGTTNGSDLASRLVSSDSRLFLFVPVSDSLVSIAAYALDFIDPTRSAIFNNFIVTDFAVTGVTGGNTKYMQLGCAPDDFSQNDAGADIYNRQVGLVISKRVTLGATSGALGSTDGTTMGLYRYGGALSGVNCVPNGLSSYTGGGHWHINRISSSSSEYYQNTTLKYTNPAASTTPVSDEFYAFANNSGGTAVNFFLYELAMVAVRCGFNANELTDWRECVAYLQANIITGGRDV